MANMTFKASLLPSTSLEYSLGSSTQLWDIYGQITAGKREVTTAPSEETEVNRITIVPYYHYGGTWDINSSDDSKNAYLKLKYGTNELIKLKHDGTFMDTLKASITGNAATATTITTVLPVAKGGTGVTSLDDLKNALFPYYSFTKTLTITTSWQNTGIQSENMPSGTYIIRMSGFHSGYCGQYEEVYSGVLSWYSGSTNSTDYDDIYLHKAGHASNSASIFLRTLRSVNTDGKFRLQIKASMGASTSTNVLFEFRRIL